MLQPNAQVKCCSVRWPTSGSHEFTPKFKVWRRFFWRSSRSSCQEALTKRFLPPCNGRLILSVSQMRVITRQCRLCKANLNNFESLKTLIDNFSTFDGYFGRWFVEAVSSKPGWRKPFVVSVWTPPANSFTSRNLSNGIFISFFIGKLAQWIQIGPIRIEREKRDSYE